MATLTIYPVENGSLAENSPNTGTAWAAVDDPAGTPDDDTTYLAGSRSSTYRYNLFPIRKRGMGTTISNVTIYWRARYQTISSKARTVVKIGGTAYYGSEQTVASSYTNYTTSYNTSPEAGNPAWTWDKIAAMEFGVGIYNTSVRVTQCYIVVTYTPGDTTISTNTTTNAQYVIDNGSTLTVNATLSRANI